MTKLEEAEAKDDILRYMLANPSIRNRFGDNMPQMFNCTTFRKTVFDLKTPVESIEHLIREILDYDSRIVANPHGSYLQVNENTQDFIYSGGFVSIYEAEQQRLEDQRVRQEESDQALKDERKKNRRQSTLIKWQLNTFVPVFLSGLLGGGYAFYNMVNESDRVTKDEVTVIVQDSIQTLRTDFARDIERMEAGLKKQNDSLREELYKADMLIAAYEEAGSP